MAERADSANRLTKLRLKPTRNSPQRTLSAPRFFIFALLCALCVLSGEILLCLLRISYVKDLRVVVCSLACAIIRRVA